MAYNEKKTISNLRQKLTTKFGCIIAIEGCKDKCATKLLKYLGLEPDKTLLLTEHYREQAKVGFSTNSYPELKTIGLLHCSGACFPTLLSRSASNIVSYKNDRLTEVCFVEYNLPLAAKKIKEITRLKEVLKRYEYIIAINACGSKCSSKLLDFYDLKPKEFNLTEIVKIPGKSLPFTKTDIAELVEPYLEVIVKRLLQFTDVFQDNKKSTDILILKR